MAEQSLSIISLIQHINIDQIIILLFLLVTLILGFIAGKGIKDIKDYSIANKVYGTPVLVLTLMATMIGGGSTTGAIAQIFTEGLIYSLAAGIGWFVSLMILGRFIASKFDDRFEGMLSISDMMRYFYGNYAEKISGILGYIFCIGIFSAQLIAMGHLTANFLGISYVNALIITSTLVISYSIAGGIRAVAITDVFQFAVLIVIVPIIANVATVEAGGLSQIFDGETMKTHLQILSHPNLIEYTSLLIYLCLPFSFIYPSLVQRYLMTKSPRQASTITYIYAILSVALVFMVTVMAFSALNLFPGIEPKSVIPTIIDKLLPIGAKGFAIAGMLAVIMSTADSALNSGGILIAHNVLPEKMFKSAKTKLNLIKICTLVSGAIAVLISTQNYNIALTVLIAETLFISVSIPLTLGILKLKVNKYCFWVCTLVNMVTFAIATFYQIPEFAAPLICMLVSLFSFLITCYITNKGKILIEPEKSCTAVKRKKIFNAFSINKYLPTPINILKFCTIKTKKFEADYLVFGIFCCVNYIVPFFMWTVDKPVHYTIMLTLRTTAGFLCVGLLVKDYWPGFSKKYFPVYWHFTLMFCLSFVTSVMFLLMNANSEWLINLALAIMLLTMLVDWMSFVFISLFGISLGYLFYTFFIGMPSINTDFHSMYLLAYVCVFSTMIGIIFARKREATADEKLEVMQLMGGVMAHEMISPLAYISMSVDHINMIMNNSKPIISNDKKNNDKKAYNFTLTGEDYQALFDTLNSLKTISTKGIKTVGHILTSIKGNVVAQDSGCHNLSTCIKEVIKEDVDPKQQKQIKVDISSESNFYGSREYLRHVFINLINNAFKYGGKDVQIDIRLKGNQLIFRDNGKGIDPEILPKIFDRFYTSSSSGTGIGLSFCKMVMEDLGGSISCNSEPGKYTEFALTFPKIA